MDEEEKQMIAGMTHMGLYLCDSCKHNPCPGKVRDQGRMLFGEDFSGHHKVLPISKCWNADTLETDHDQQAN